MVGSINFLQWIRGYRAVDLFFMKERSGLRDFSEKQKDTVREA